MEQNGDLFDDIEANVGEAHDYIRESVTEYLPEANEYARKARSKQAGASPNTDYTSE